MSIIKLLNTKQYAEKKHISRVTIWRQARNGLLDCYTLPGSCKKWYVEKEPSRYNLEQNILDEILTVDLN